MVLNSSNIQLNSINQRDVEIEFLLSEENDVSFEFHIRKSENRS